MPIYEYRCEECAKTSEMLVRSSNAEVRCSHCGSSRLIKLLSAFATTQSSDGSCDMQSSCPAAPCCGGACSGKH